MENLFDISAKSIQGVSLDFKRFLYTEINWERRLIAIKGARGTGKTTLILQFLKENFGLTDEAIYLSLDHIYFSDNRLIDFVDHFVKNGGKYLFLDEVHKYPGWSQEIKNLYDQYPELKVIFTGSSVLEIDKSKADLSRRAMLYTLPSLSLREFVELQYGISFPSFTLNEILNRHKEIAAEFSSKIKPVKAFNEFNRFGAYPFFKETGEDYHHHLERIVNLMLETDLPGIINMDYSSIVKIKKLLYIISHSVPFKPNISELSRKIGIVRDTLLRYLHYLEQAQLILSLNSPVKGLSYMSKPAKLYLNNGNLFYAINPNIPEKGTLRETFFLNQLSAKQQVDYSKEGDFRVDDQYIFEIGGKNKTTYQISGLENSFLAIDDVEYGYKNRIPLWMFGFLY
ncbi:MAG: AAA family ATPase [Bacteroidales bacterium]|nr:AAA family ATPase [Bacteroidales bacterium]